MRKEYRLRDPSQIKHLLRSGRRVETALFRVVARNNGLFHPRFVFIAGKSVDKRATVRNRLRRRVREWIRTRPELLKMPLDIAFFFKKEGVDASNAVFYGELKKTISKL